MTLASPPPARKFPLFGAASAATAVLTVVTPVAVFMHFASKANDPQAQGFVPLSLLVAGGFYGLLTAGASGLLGTLIGGIALVRGERKGWLAAVGLAVNVPAALLLLTLAALTVSHRGG